MLPGRQLLQNPKGKKNAVFPADVGVCVVPPQGGWMGGCGWDRPVRMDQWGIRREGTLCEGGNCGMEKLWKTLLSGLVLLAFVPASLLALNVVYTNNDISAGNTVSAYSVSSTGALTFVGTYNTGGLGTGGGLYSADRIVVVKTSANNTFVYASNAGSNTVSGFKVDPSTGALTSVSTTPYSTLAYNSTNESGISLAATPDGNYLYAGSTGFNGQITIFQIDPNTGALTANPTLVQADGPMTSMKVTPSGGLLVLAIKDQNEIQTFKIGQGGALSSASAAIQFGTAFTGVDVNCAGTYVYAGTYGTTVEVYSLDSSTGALTYLSSSPAVGTITSNQVVRLSADDSMLYASTQGSQSVTEFNVDSSTGALSGGTAIGIGNQYAYPGGLAVSQDGTLLYAASAQPALTVYGANPFGFDSITAASTVPALDVVGYGLLSVAAFPAKACSSPTTLNATLDVSAGPPPSFDLNATLDTGSGGGVIDPLTQPVTLQIGNSSYTYSVTIPAGSFNTHQNGSKAGIYVFQGGLDGATLKVQIALLSPSQFQISAYVKKVDLTNLANPLTVNVTIGGNSASTTVNATTIN